MSLFDRLPRELQLEVLTYLDASDIVNAYDTFPSLNPWPTSLDFIHLLHNCAMKIDWLDRTLYRMLLHEIGPASLKVYFDALRYYRKREQSVNILINKLHLEKKKFSFGVFYNKAIDCAARISVIKTLCSLAGRDMTYSATHTLDNTVIEQVLTLGQKLTILVDIHSLPFLMDEEYAVKQAHALKKYDGIIFLINSKEDGLAWDHTQDQFEILTKAVNEAQPRNRPLLIVLDINKESVYDQESPIQYLNCLPKVAQHLNHGFFHSAGDTNVIGLHRRIWRLWERDAIYINFEKILRWAITEIAIAKFC